MAELADALAFEARFCWIITSRGSHFVVISVKAENATYALHFTDGPLEGQTFHLTGVVPFIQFQIGGTIETPVFHMYGLDAAAPDVQDIEGGGAPVRYKFKKTYTFEELAETFPFI